MTITKNSSLIQLTEVFPTWSQEDLLSALNEAGGDVYVAISRISEGHVSQWSGGSTNIKKSIGNSEGFDTRSMRSDRGYKKENQHNNNNSSNNYSNNTNNNRTENSTRNPQRISRDRPQSQSSKAPMRKSVVPPVQQRNHKDKIPPVVEAVKDDLSWGNSEVTSFISIVDKGVVSVSERAVKESKTSFAEAAASAVKKIIEVESVPLPVSAPAPVAVTVESEMVLEAEPVVTVSKIEKFEEYSSETGDQAKVESVGIVAADESTNAPAVIEQPTFVAAVDDEEDEEIVFMPSRCTPSLTMEQPAVVLPVRTTNYRTNLTVRFGYESVEEAAAAANASDDNNNNVVATEELKGKGAEKGKNATVAETQSSLKHAEPIAMAWNNTNTRGNPSNINTPNNNTNFLRTTGHQAQMYQTQAQGQGQGQGMNTNNANAASGYGNFSRDRPQQGQGEWDYESSPSHNNHMGIQGSFGPAPGFSGPTSSAAGVSTTSTPQRYVSRSGAHYEQSGAASANVNARYSPYEESLGATVAGVGDTHNNNVSQYYTTRPTGMLTSQSQVAPAGYAPVYRGGGNSSFNPAASRYTSPNSNPNRPYYPPQQPHYSPYNNYVNNYHPGGYPQYPSENQTLAQAQAQAYYQPYQPPNQYLSNPHPHPDPHHNNTHHNHNHHQNNNNQHHNA